MQQSLLEVRGPFDVGSVSVIEPSTIPSGKNLEADSKAGSSRKVMRELSTCPYDRSLLAEHNAINVIQALPVGYYDVIFDARLALRGGT
jgi:hypothetical protein